MAASSPGSVRRMMLGILLRKGTIKNISSPPIKCVGETRPRSRTQLAISYPNASDVILLGFAHALSRCSGSAVQDGIVRITLKRYVRVLPRTTGSDRTPNFDQSGETFC